MVITAVAQALIFLAGLSIGVRSGVVATRSCTAELATGAPVVADGVLLDRVPAVAPEAPGGPQRTTRARLRDVRLVSGGRRCRVPGIRAYVHRGTRSLAAGERVLLRGSWRRYASGRGPRSPAAYGWVGGARPDFPDRAGGGSPAVRLARWRGALAGRLADRLAPSSAPVGIALILADRSALSPETRRLFADAGVVHLLAISGLHVGLVGAGLAWLVGRRVRGPRRFAWAATLVAGYVALVGSPPSAVRAALIFAGYAGAALRGRPARLGDLAALAAILAILADPLVLADIGFQLSFAGFAGVVAGARVARSRPLVVRRWRPLVEAVAVGSGAFLATAPLTAVHFDRIVLASIPAGIAATGLVVLALPGLALTLLLPAPLHTLVAPAVDLLIAGMQAVANAFASLPLRWAAPALGPAGWTLLAGALLLGLDRSRRRGPAVAWLLAGIVTALALGPGLEARLARGRALLCTLDVGQGDAAVIRTGAGRWIVLDAGPGRGFDIGPGGGGPPPDLRSGDAGRDVLVPFLRARGARDIALFALSHPHLDHFGGSAALFDAFRVRRVLDPAVPEPSHAYAALLERSREEGARWLPGLSGDRIEVDDATIEVLWPDAGRPEDANEGSLVLRVTVDGFRYLNTGDAPKEVEDSVLARHGPARVEAEVLKIGHHGSRTSTSRAWIDAVAPEIAVISAGRGNRYGHPHASVLARLDSTRARIWRTDRDGSLCIGIQEGAWKLLEGV